MKKFLAMILALVMALSLVACGDKKDDTKTDDNQGDTTETTYKVAMITDYGDITDQSFNQTTYEACKAFADANKIEFSYFKPAGDNTADRVAMIESAVDEGYNVIVMPGYAFGGAIVEAAPQHKDVKFIALDVGKGDLLEAGVAAKGESYDYNPDNWDLATYVDMSNVYCAIYQEELCGYMAGYAAVKLGYKNLGFLGGMAVPAVVRYGFGYVQGVDAAAKELGITVDLKYAYGNQFVGDADITAAMDTWYQGGTEIVFACGGGIYASAVEAANIHGAKVVGVDVDQSYIDACIVTSAMKGLQNVTETILADLEAGKWESTYGGKFITYSLSEGDYVGIPTAESSWRFNNFTMEQYEAVHAKLMSGEIVVDNNSDNVNPEIEGITVNYVD